MSKKTTLSEADRKHLRGWRGLTNVEKLQLTERDLSQAALDLLVEKKELSVTKEWSLLQRVTLAFLAGTLLLGMFYAWVMTTGPSWYTQEMHGFVWWKGILTWLVMLSCSSTLAIKRQMWKPEATYALPEEQIRHKTKAKPTEKAQKQDGESGAAGFFSKVPSIQAPKAVSEEAYQVQKWVALFKQHGNYIALGLVCFFVVAALATQLTQWLPILIAIVIAGYVHVQSEGKPAIIRKVAYPLIIVTAVASMILISGLKNGNFGGLFNFSANNVTETEVVEASVDTSAIDAYNQGVVDAPVLPEFNPAITSQGAEEIGQVANQFVIPAVTLALEADTYRSSANNGTGAAQIDFGPLLNGEAGSTGVLESFNVAADWLMSGHVNADNTYVSRGYIERLASMAEPTDGSVPIISVEDKARLENLAKRLIIGEPIEGTTLSQEAARLLQGTHYASSSYELNGAYLNLVLMLQSLELNHQDWEAAKLYENRYNAAANIVNSELAGLGSQARLPLLDNFAGKLESAAQPLTVEVQQTATPMPTQQFNPENVVQPTATQTPVPSNTPWPTDVPVVVPTTAPTMTPWPTLVPTLEPQQVFPVNPTVAAPNPSGNEVIWCDLLEPPQPPHYNVRSNVNGVGSVLIVQGPNGPEPGHIAVGDTTTVVLGHQIEAWPGFGFALIRAHEYTSDVVITVTYTSTYCGHYWVSYPGWDGVMAVDAAPGVGQFVLKPNAEETFTYWKDGIEYDAFTFQPVNAP
ncbi:MAG: hypothetical protein ACOZAO_01395 [Patescibacteria group bacterium]